MDLAEDDSSSVTNKRKKSSAAASTKASTAAAAVLDDDSNTTATPTTTFTSTPTTTPKVRGQGSAMARRLAAREPQPQRLEDVSDNQLATMDFKILMKLMDKAGLTAEEVNEVKSKRRRLKNRLSARVCSNKKREKCSELEDTNRVLVQELNQLRHENERLRQESSSLQTALHKQALDAAQEAAVLRVQIAQLTQLLANTGLLQEQQADNASAAIAA